MLNKSREQIAALLKTTPEQILFTSGGTESNNLAVLGAAAQYAGRGKHIVTTAIEHASVYECFRHLEQNGFDVTYVAPGTDGIVRAESVLEALRDDTILVSVMHVNNEIGTIQPVAAIGQALKRHPRIVFHVDAVQSVGKIPVQLSEWGIDLLSVSGHKFRGPRGTGLLVTRKGLLLRPILFGGGQERGQRSGTENVPGIVGMAKALRMSLEQQQQHATVMTSLRAQLLARLSDIPELVYNGSVQAEEMAPHIVSVSLPGMKSEVVVHALEEQGFAISTKSACSSGEDRPSRVLLSCRADQARAASGLRISLSGDHTMEQIDRLADALHNTVSTLNDMSARHRGIPAPAAHVKDRRFR
ncbi:MAG: aminotransferase [Paenibacillus sp.]|nr:aminotransferase [Paenibacillus sp.]